VKPDHNDRRIYLGMPGYGKQTSKAGMSFWRACANMTHVSNDYRASSLLAANFNQLWTNALNVVHGGGRIDYFAMLHDDIGCGDGWLDRLIDELECQDLDVLGVAIPIKDRRGLTSIALSGAEIGQCESGSGESVWISDEAHHEFRPLCRLTLNDVFNLPLTFTSEDVGHPLLLNTGCWVCKFDMSWATKVHFEINDRIVFDRSSNSYRAETEPEDWNFSRQLHELGLKIGATRKIAAVHQGEEEYVNWKAWGTEVFDSEHVAESPVDFVKREKLQEAKEYAEPELVH
jgi:hypothetical protein